jgi:hypothetical protein
MWKVSGLEARLFVGSPKFDRRDWINRPRGAACSQLPSGYDDPGLERTRPRFSVLIVARFLARRAGARIQSQFFP